MSAVFRSFFRLIDLSTPLDTAASGIYNKAVTRAGVAELADARDLKSKDADTFSVRVKELKRLKTLDFWIFIEVRICCFLVEFFPQFFPMLAWRMQRSR